MTRLTTSNTLSTNSLKVFAIIAMACDHIPYLSEAALPEYYAEPWFLMHAFGRFTAPIFFYLLALGYRRTRNANRYTLRLLVFALIAYAPYILYFHGGDDGAIGAQNFLKLNVIFTMLVGLLLLRSVHEVRNTAAKAVCIVLCLFAGYWCDYGLYGLALILVCDIAAGSRRRTVLGMGAVIMVYTYVRTSGWFSGDVSPLDYPRALLENPQALHILVVLLCQLLPLILIARHRVWAADTPLETKPDFLAKWGFYVFYPAHITILLLIRTFVM